MFVFLIVLRTVYENGGYFVDTGTFYVFKDNYHLAQDVQKHSVHTLVFRSLKRTHDMFVSDQAKGIAQDEER